MNEEEIKKKLSQEEYSVLREGNTETPFTGKLLNNKEEGLYKCKVCGSPLFSSADKFDSGTGWPSFSDIVSNKNIEMKKDDKFGMNRVEVLCKKCGSHLGHVFNDGPYTSPKSGKSSKEIGLRYCINSVCLEFDSDDKTNK